MYSFYSESYNNDFKLKLISEITSRTSLSALLVDDGYAEIICLVVKLELGAVDGSVILVDLEVRFLGAVEHNDTFSIRGLNANGLAVFDRKREDAGAC